MEVNLDAIVGPSHHFGGLAYGDLASMSHEGWCSYPKKAAFGRFFSFFVEIKIVR